MILMNIGVYSILVSNSPDSANQPIVPPNKEFRQEDEFYVGQKMGFNIRSFEDRVVVSVGSYLVVPHACTHFSLSFRHVLRCSYSQLLLQIMRTSH